MPEEYGKRNEFATRKASLPCGQVHVSACHCEERSDVAIRIPCGRGWWGAVLWANTKNVTNLPWYHVIAMCTPACFCMSLRGAERRDNPHPLRQGVVGSSALGEYEKRDKFAMVPRHCHVYTCMFLHVIARSGATWQSVLLAAAHGEREYFGRIREMLRICPNGSQLVKYLCGDADCHTSVRTGSQ